MGQATKQLPWSKQADVQEYRNQERERSSTLEKSAVSLEYTHTQIMSKRHCVKSTFTSQIQLLMLSEVLTALILYKLQRSNGGQGRC